MHLACGFPNGTQNTFVHARTQVHHSRIATIIDEFHSKSMKVCMVWSKLWPTIWYLTILELRWTAHTAVMCSDSAATGTACHAQDLSWVLYLPARQCSSTPITQDMRHAHDTFSPDLCHAMIQVWTQLTTKIEKCSSGCAKQNIHDINELKQHLIDSSMAWYKVLSIMQLVYGTNVS